MMKSKSFDLGHSSGDNLKQNRSFDFVELYKSSTNSSASWTERNAGRNNDTDIPELMSQSKGEKSPNKRQKKKPVFVKNPQHIIGHPINDSEGSTLNDSKVTCTPICNKKKTPKVKSIMRVSATPGVDDSMDDSNVDVSRPKKRNKSVSFMLENNEEVSTKKVKSDDSLNSGSKKYTSDNKMAKKHLKKIKKDQNDREDKENTSHVDRDRNVKHKKSKRNTENIEGPIDSIGNAIEKEKTHKTKRHQNDDEDKEITNRNIDRDLKTKKAKKSKISTETDILNKDSIVTVETSTEMGHTHKNKKIKKSRNHDENGAIQDISVTVTQNGENERQIKKKKHQERCEKDNEWGSKYPEEDDKPDVVVELKNLSIGDNAHTLTNLLHEMTVVDGEKRKKKASKNKKLMDKANDDENAENNVDDKERKWSRRKWNKDTKAVREDSTEHTVLVQDLPLSLLFSYKKLLAEHFGKYGLIKSVGIAEVYLPDNLSGVFTTTVHFYSDGAAAQALQEQQKILGQSVSLRRPAPPAGTRVVARSYGPLTEHALSSLLHAAGRIRHIRHAVKGRNTMATFFIEFDAPEAVERALVMAADAKVGGKNVYISRFEDRTKNKKKRTGADHDGAQE